MLNRFVSLILLIFVQGILIAFLFDGYVMAQDKDLGADSITPIASGITDFEPTIKLKDQDQEIKVKTPYARQGNNIFLLPAWWVRSVYRIAEGKPKTDLKPSDLVFDPMAGSSQRLEVILNNLLADEFYGKAIREKLRTKLAEEVPGTTNYAFQSPLIRTQSFRFTLIAPGLGNKNLPAEVPISEEFERLPNGAVRFIIDQEKLKVVEKENGSPLKLAQVLVQCTGLMRVRFEQIQVEAQVDFVKGAFNELKKSVSSIRDFKGESPEVFVDSYGGEAKSESQIRQLADQSLNVTISSRFGAETAPIMSMVKDQLSSILEQQKVKVSDENKQIAFLLDNQVSITATIGEIKRLAKRDEKQREAHFKDAYDNFESSIKGEKSSYSGEMRFGYSGPFNSFKADGGLAATANNGTSSETASKAKAEKESLRRGYQKLLKDFEGRIPTLSGISFNDNIVRESFDRATKTFKESKITTADSLHRWPLIGLAGFTDKNLSKEDLARDFMVLKGDYESLLGLVGTVGEIKQAKESLRALQDINKQYLSKLAGLDEDYQRAKKDHGAALKSFKDESKAELAKLNNEEIRNLREAVDKLEGRDREVKKLALIPKGAKVSLSNSIAMSFVPIDEGEFQMGSPPEDELRYSDEDYKKIKIEKRFYLGAFEVTQGNFEDLNGKIGLSYKNPSKYKEGPRNSPIENISFNEAVEFCHKLSSLPEEKEAGRLYRLPSEVEWEYACRSGKNTIYSFGNSLFEEEGTYKKPRAVFDTTQPRVVGTFSPNQWGLFDMHGNVAEICDSLYAGISDNVVIRGGSWFSFPRLCRSAYRQPFVRDGRADTVGFRVLLEIIEIEIK